MKKLFLTTTIIAMVHSGFAQNEVDALRYSLQDVFGTARSQGMAGAFGAAGADLSSFFLNPAGIGLYKMNETAFGLALHDNLNNTQYHGKSTDNTRANFNFNHFGFVQTKKQNDSKWISTSFGVAYMRTRTFHENFTVQGSEMNTTFLDVLALQGAGTHPDFITDEYGFGAGLAYQTYLIDPSDSLGSSYIPVVSGGKVDQMKSVKRRGQTSQTALGFAANYDDRLYVGFSIAINGLSFSEESQYTESGFENTDLESYTFNQNLQSSGLGINFKLGVIGKPTEWMRVGASVQTPSYIGIDDSYTASMTSSFEGDENYQWDSPTGMFGYNLRTPARYIGNIAFVLGKSGILTADYEYADYGHINMKTSQNDLYTYDFVVENQTIRDIYRGVHKVRAGIEWRIMNEFRLRAGAGYEQSPFVNGAAPNTPWITFAGGGGYRGDHFFADLAVTHQQRQEVYYLYDPQMVDASTINSTRVQALFSLGVRF